MVVKGQFNVLLAHPALNFRTVTETLYRRPIFFPINGTGHFQELNLPIDVSSLSNSIELTTFERYNSTVLLARFAHTGSCTSQHTCGLQLEGLEIDRVFPVAKRITCRSTTANAEATKECAGKVSMFPQEIVTFFVFV